MDPSWLGFISRENQGNHSFWDANVRLLCDTSFGAGTSYFDRGYEAALNLNSAPVETMANHCWLVFTGESSLQGFLGGAGVVHPQ